VNVDGRTIGLIVDAAREFVSIAADSIEPPPDAVSGLGGNYLEGIASLGDRIVLMLDLAEVVRAASETVAPEGA